MDPLSRRLFFLYEAPEDGGGEAPPVEEPAAAAPAEEPWSLRREDWEAAVSYLQSTAPLMQEVARLVETGQITQGQAQEMLTGQAGIAPTPEPETFDPFDPDSVQRYIQSQVQSGIQNAVAPYEQVMQTVAADEGARAAEEELQAIAHELGNGDAPAEFNRDLAVMIAAGYMNDPNADPALALRSSARFVYEMEQQIRADERARFKSELDGLANAPADISVGGAAASEGAEVPTGPSRYRDVVENVLARRAQARI